MHCSISPATVRTVAGLSSFPKCIHQCTPAPYAAGNLTSCERGLRIYAKTSQALISPAYRRDSRYVIGKVTSQFSVSNHVTDPPLRGYSSCARRYVARTVKSWLNP
jgi:hypothetical protein